MAATHRFPLHTLFPDLPSLHIVDVGASTIDGDPPYQPLIAAGAVSQVTCFEPNPDEFQKLQAAKPSQRILPHALGDGNEAVLNVCAAPGMSSLLEPDMNVLGHFHGFIKWARVLSRIPVRTVRLDDVHEIGRVDYLKLDVQGSELSVLRNASQTLARTLIVHLEMPFIPLYRNQPLFGELDAFLRSAGFCIHCFTRVSKRAFQPIMKADQYQGFNQIFEADAVYVRDFTRFSELDPPGLLKLARVAHDLWASIDLAALALVHVDRQIGSNRQEQYRQQLSAKP